VDTNLTKRLASSYVNDYGFTVIPIEYRGKRPTVNWLTYVERKPTQDELDLWFSKPANVAILTGKLSGVCGLDIDDEQTFNELCSVENFIDQNGLICKTGKGFHIYFKPAEWERTWTFRKNGLTHHVKYESSVLVAPPSVHPSGREYAWYSQGSIQWLHPKQIRRAIESIGGEPVASEGKDRSITWASELCQSIPRGERNVRAAQLCGLLIRKFNHDPGLIKGLMKAWNSYYVDPPLSDREITTLVEGEIQRYTR
jgi:hypothetical protein